ncbi:MAG: hypothetical protein RL431_223 [Actinomycetota bacterium]|jgi:hypothetical protein
MKSAASAALAVAALMAFPGVAFAVDAEPDTTQAIVESVLDDLGVDADDELIALIVSDVDPELLNPELVDAVDSALAEGEDPDDVITEITVDNLDEQSVLWEENGEDWAQTAPAVRPDRHSTIDTDDDEETDPADPAASPTPTPRPTSTVRPSPTPRPTSTTRPTSTPRPTPSESDDDDDDDRDDDHDDDHSDDDD